MLRPRPCRWFVLIAPRAGLAPVLEALARSGAVELQAQEHPASMLVVGGAEDALATFHALARRSRRYWPVPAASAGGPVSDPAATLQRRVAQLQAWSAEADPWIAELETLGLRVRHLQDVGQLLAAGGATLPDLGLLSAAGRFLVGLRLFAVDAGAPLPVLPAQAITVVVPAGGERFVLVAGPQAALVVVDEAFATRRARRIDWPSGLHGSGAEAGRELAARIAALDARRSVVEAQLAALAARHELAAALSDIERVEWLVHHGRELAASERLVWVSGWTTAADEAAFALPLQRQGLACVAHFPSPPVRLQPPSVLANPRWARPFEAFARLLGQPAPDEADPSRPLALIAPLLFGFMFGDVGQGAVLCGSGWLLKRRWPALALLVPGGAMAIVFGLLFGSVFAREDLIPALWQHPLQAPLPLLAAALALGAALLAFGLLLNALQAYWRHALRAWWAQDAGLLLAYSGALAAPWQAQALWAVAVGAAWAAFGGALSAPDGRIAAALRGLAQFVEHALQLAVNTVSFARVGAFALAHAGLSVAVTGLAAAAGTVGGAVVLVLGNLLIVALEGLVVGIQTTRLLLFEFFARFLQGRGRAFRPLAPPVLPSPT